MKKSVLLLLLLSLVLNSALALDQSVEAFVKLPVPTNSVKIGFSDSILDADAGVTTNEFSMKAPNIDGAFNISSEDKGDIYLFYKGIGEVSNCTLSVEIMRPFTWFDGTNYSSDPNDVIHFTIDVFCDTGCNWDGSNKELLKAEGISVLSNAATKKKSIETALRGIDAEMNMVKGVARVSVTIPPTDVTGKKYGTYKSELKLTLTSN